LITRRTFLIVGAGGAAALAAAHWLRHPGEEVVATPGAAPWSGLDPQAREIVAAIAPVLLEGALPAAASDRQAALDETIDDVGRAIAGLVPSVAHELDQLFALLAFAPARRLLARVSAPWREAAPADVAAFLERWRRSGWALQRSAYDAFHQLVFAAWYGNPRSWPATGYGGPPRLG
jgi:hypothetical protein